MGKARLAFNRDVTEFLHDRGHRSIRPAAANVFRGLDVRGTTITVLAERAAVSKQTMWALVRKLEDDGYVGLQPHPRDGRAKLVKLTPAGRRLARDIIASAKQVEARLASRIGQARMQSLRKGLEMILEELGETYRTDWR